MSRTFVFGRLKAFQYDIVPFGELHCQNDSSMYIKPSVGLYQHYESLRSLLLCSLKPQKKEEEKKKNTGMKTFRLNNKNGHESPR